MMTVFLVLNLIVLAYVAYVLVPIARAKARENARAKMVETVIAFGPTKVAAKSTFIFSTPVRTDFSGTRLVVPDAVSTGFVVSDIRADRESIMSGAIPAAVFSEQAVGVRLDMPKLAGGKHVLLTVSNESDDAKTFSAALIGLTPRAQMGGGPEFTTLPSSSEPTT